MWLQSWVGLLILSNLLAILFVVGREDESWKVRPEPIAILIAFFAAAALMNWLYTEIGYVRLLGVAHLVFWTPVWVWVLIKRKAIGWATLYGKYIHLYLVMMHYRFNEHESLCY